MYLAVTTCRGWGHLHLNREKWEGSALLQRLPGRGGVRRSRSLAEPLRGGGSCHDLALASALLGKDMQMTRWGQPSQSAGVSARRPEGPCHVASGSSRGTSASFDIKK